MAGNGNFKWWCASFEDSEIWRGPFDTRAEAIAAGNADAVDDEADHFFIGEADKTVAAPRFNAEALVERLIEELCENNGECWGEDGPDDPWVTAETKELATAIETAVAAWMLKHPARTFCLSDWREWEKVKTAHAVKALAF